jgi:type VI secretion system secreted protein Hcp
MPIYMKYGGITGDVTAAGHEGWIELNTLQWGVGRSISSATGSSEDRESSAPSVSEVSATKAFDKASIKLLTEAYQGTGSGDAATVQIDFVRTNKDTLVVYGTLILSNVMVSGYSISSGGDRPVESLTLNFVKVETDFIPMKPDGTPDNPMKITYDLGQAKTV